MKGNFLMRRISAKTWVIFSAVMGLALLVLPACKESMWNDPHPVKYRNANVRFSSFSEQPKTLDPAKSYSSGEYRFIAQIYEPPLQYHYLKRPYTLEPLTAVQMPTVTYLDKNHISMEVNSHNDDIAFTQYDIFIKPDIRYAPHPAFAKIWKEGKLQYVYHHLTEEDIEDARDLKHFKITGTRELTADDYVYQIKRLAAPEIHSPILGVMEKYIVGLPGYVKLLKKNCKPEEYCDLRKYPLEGVKVIGPYHYRILIKGLYPQFKYWLAMPFFAPIPWEADYFYSQKGLDEHNIGFDWFPVGTGPYQLTENNPNQQMVLSKNTLHRIEYYPCEGSDKAKEKGLLKDCGKPIPFIDKYIFSLEKEGIPRWSKFLQGYYDASNISPESFDQAIKIDAQGKPHLTPMLKDKSIKLFTSVNPSIFYLGFNMLDPVVGGESESARKLRQAISIAVNYEEYISIFLNGRGMSAQGPLPPGIFGYKNGEAGTNTEIYGWTDGKRERKSLAEARQLLKEAGYGGGIDKKHHRPLLLYYDVTVSGGPEDKARLNWMRKQFRKLGIQLQVRSTQYNRFQEKMRTGNAQIFGWGWNADYPDPENFLFLLYGKNGKVKYGGENAANYQNAVFDQLFDKMKNMSNGPGRQAVIDQMVALVRHDMPWIWGVYPKDFTLTHVWNKNTEINAMANNSLKYQGLDVSMRAEKKQLWNHPSVWPLVILFAFILLVLVPVTIQFWVKEHRPARKASANSTQKPKDN